MSRKSKSQVNKNRRKSKLSILNIEEFGQLSPDGSVDIGSKETGGDTVQSPITSTRRRTQAVEEIDPTLQLYETYIHCSS